MEQHEEIIKGAMTEQKDIFDSSDQAMYLYLDDAHKACNERFSSMLGYGSPREWADSLVDFTDTFVAEKSRISIIEAYRNAMDRGEGSFIEVEWKHKTGHKVKTKMIMVPIEYHDQRMALHFITKKK